MPEILNRIEQIIDTNLIDIKNDFKIYWKNFLLLEFKKVKTI